MIASLLLLAAAAPGAPAAAPPAPAPAAPSTDIGFITARELAAKCSDGSAAGLSYCFAYIAAVHDTMRAYEIWLGQKEFCLPAGSSQGDIRRTFLTYLSAYPDQGSGQAASVVAVALKQTYICPSAPPAPSPAPRR